MHLFEQEYYEESRALLYRAAAVDGERPVDERKQARMLIGIIQNYDRKYAEGETVLKEALGVRPVTEYDPKMMFVLARLYVAWGKKADGARACCGRWSRSTPTARSPRRRRSC